MALTPREQFDCPGRDGGKFATLGDFIAKTRFAPPRHANPSRRENRRIYVACDLDDLFLLAPHVRCSPWGDVRNRQIAVRMTCLLSR